MPKVKGRTISSKEVAHRAAPSVPSSPSTSKKSANLQFFSTQECSAKQLKAQAKKLFHQRTRQKFTYQQNHTASLALPLSSELLNPHEQSNAQLLLLAQKNILEHANMRVDLFFYTMIAYYQKNLHPVLGHTYLQHGRGRSSETQQLLSEACHNSILPALIDETILSTDPQNPKACLLSGTHFMNSLNSTTELPPFVNDLDDVIEQLCRERALVILQAVSRGSINPVEGLNLFLQLLKTSLDMIGQKACREKNLFLSELVDLVVQGSLSQRFDEETETASDEYVQMVLQLSSKEKKDCLNRKQKDKVYTTKFAQIQTEILSTEVELLISSTDCKL
ncbi:hypothetical protein J2N86_10780 [Legionella lytica]|uniref:Uncharacterized protein n=1 Tax=Legionella lytica TaxID=96232 RepID=A0ABY4Y7U6_9GAMM|nr:hypothetical protein [Legionella lytica]USQ13169.1 hypothetical protein J2N86_10780 [Legionella lytica]